MATLPGDVDLAVYFGWGDDPTTTVASITWTDMTSRVRAVEITRGTSSWPSPFSPGTARIVLDNDDGELDPDNGASAYAGDMEVGVPAKVEMSDSSSTTEELFVGYVRLRQGYEVTYPVTGTSNLIANCVDRHGIFAEATYDGGSRLTNNAKTLIESALGDVASGGFDDTKSFDDGVGELDTAGSFVWDKSLGAFIDKVVASDGGWFFIARDGTSTFIDRHAFIDTAALNTSQVTFTDGDATSDTDYLQGMSRSFGDRQATTARVTDVNGDQSSETIAGGLSWSASSHDVGDTYLANANFADDLAWWWATLLSTVDSHPAQLSVVPFTSDACRDAVATLDLLHRVTVKFTPPGLSEQTHTCQVVGIRHQITPGSWRTGFSLISADFIDATNYDGWLVLGDATVGKIGTGKFGA